MIANVENQIVDTMQNCEIRVRFAPAPTGSLHIGGARTALFNYLFAKRYSGKFLLRIEDTDQKRSTPEAVQTIFKSLGWLGLNPDEAPTFQNERSSRHLEIAKLLLEQNRAYYCYTTVDELEAFRAQAKDQSKPPKFNSPWRDNEQKNVPKNVNPAIRLRAPQSGTTTINDLVQGEVKVQNDQLDDMILVRPDGTPTYMLAVVVDDYDMKISHIIRGDDHLTNTFRQLQIYGALEWKAPQFAHIPLIHGADGAKLSKRHGALSVEHYKEQGYLPEALNNYLLRLGWGHGDHELLSHAQACALFSLDGVGKSPSRLDLAKLNHINGHYLQLADNQELLKLVVPFIETNVQHPLSAQNLQKIGSGLQGLKMRAKTLIELAHHAQIYLNVVPPVNEAGLKLLTLSNLLLLKQILNELIEPAIIDPVVKLNDTIGAPQWEENFRVYAKNEQLKNEKFKLANLVAPLRVALTGSNVSPSIFEVMEIIGNQQIVERINNILEHHAASNLDHHSAAADVINLI